VIIDLTHEIDNRVLTYPKSSDVAPHLEQSADISSDGYRNFTLTMGMHVGTHIDAPAHMLNNGITIDQIPLTQLCCSAHIINAQEHGTIDTKEISSLPNKPGDALLIATGHDKYWGTSNYFTQHPTLTAEAVNIIIDKKFGMLGLDTPSPDTYPFELHKMLFKDNVLIVENLTHLTDLVNKRDIMIFALPLKCKTDGAPARVIATCS
jgi:kynurenine formamidase